MYLKEIRTSGFKSFAEKTKIELNKGIAGVVGPNGSGKSNIVDAVRWVLGEQSVKQLRGEGLMSDVIFSGSKSRRAAQSASVTLVFDNTDKYLPLDYTEVSIKRCIYKTGENEYYLNNEKVRLKDIQDLLVDTGVNKESFNIISQGDIGAILSNKPEERRIIFESAAGTLKYKKRKDEALRKLDRTHDNMSRVNDIILELETSIAPLKKQSSDAKKYLENKSKLDEVEVSLIVSEVDKINAEYQLNKHKINELSEDVIKLEKDSNVSSSKVEELKLIQTKKEEELYKMQSLLTKKVEEARDLLGKKDLIVERQKYDAKGAINFLKVNKFGRATFFPLNIIKKREIDRDTYRILKDLSEFIGVASDLVRYESTYDNIIKNQLGTTIVVSDIDSANKVARKINYRYKIVTLEGELLHQGGSLTGGNTKATTNLIAQKHDLEDNLKYLENLQIKRSEIEEAINKNDDLYKSVLEERNKLLEEKTNYEISLKFESERYKLFSEELEKLKTESKTLDELESGTLSKEEEKIVEEYYEKEKEKNELSLKIDSLKSEITDYKDTIFNMEKNNKLNNQEYYSKTKELKDLEIKVNRADVMLDNLLNTLTEDYSMTFSNAKANYFLDMDPKEAREIVDKCKAEIKKLGDVNVGAIEEYERVSKRYEFLTAQKSDLEKAEDTILEIIKELDGIMKEKFLETFDVIKVKFKEVFKKLFSGGDAELKLTNPEDVLTTGIDIKALPPGKTLRHISLLSGGEKTLTAISLLFAILETRPVPFCILDEVEAALDEVNVDNFGKFLNEFKNKTQFIVITHKKKTMEYADVLYGITMQESGVSKLVSVKLEDIKDDKES